MKVKLENEIIYSSCVRYVCVVNLYSQAARYKID